MLTTWIFDGGWMRISRPVLTVIVTMGVLAAPLAVEAQPASKVYRIGLLSTMPPDTSATRLWEAFRQGLRELGYIEGWNLVIEQRYPSGGSGDQLPNLAAELVRLKVDVIVAGGSLTPHAAKRATTTIPIVMGNHGDPVGSGLVTSLARPGGTVTGLSLLSTELAGKQLELLREAVSGVARVTVLWNPTSQTHARMLGEAEAAARALGLRFHRLPARGPEEYEGAFLAMRRERADAVLVLGDPIFWYHRTRLAALAAKQRLPAMFGQREHAEAGGLISYGANLRDNYRRAATYVDKILKGAKPADLPVEQPTKFELVINLKTAKALGLTIPPSLLLRADEIIE
jgi:putative ABC transport system substrate-binding protein